MQMSPADSMFLCPVFFSKSNKVSLGAQLAEPATQSCSVTGL